MTRIATKAQMSASVKAHNAAQDAAYAEVTTAMVAADPSLKTAGLMDARWDARRERVTAAAKAAQAAYLAERGLVAPVRTAVDRAAERAEIERFLDRS